MELLLNLVWVAVASVVLSAFLRRRLSCAWTARVPYLKALLALSCILVLLFPVVSASDDLHPTQAVLDETTKRIHLLVAPLQHAQGNGTMSALPALLAIYLLCTLLILRWRPSDVWLARVPARERLTRAGRAPPSF